MEEVEKIDKVLGEVQKIFPRQRPQRAPGQHGAGMLVNALQIIHHRLTTALVEQQVKIGKSAGDSVTDAARQDAADSFGEFQLEKFDAHVATPAATVAGRVAGPSRLKMSRAAVVAAWGRASLPAAARICRSFSGLRRNSST